MGIEEYTPHLRRNPDKCAKVSIERARVLHDYKIRVELLQKDYEDAIRTRDLASINWWEIGPEVLNALGKKVNLIRI